MAEPPRAETIAVQVGPLQIGGGAPVVVQSMTNTPTADIGATAAQIVALIEAGSEMVRFTIDSREAAAATPEIARRVRDAGYPAPLIGDFHYNGHALLREYPDCARALDKYRINPGNVGSGASYDANFEAFCHIARDNGKPVRIGVNSGSLNQDVVAREMTKNAGRKPPRPPEDVLNECMILSAIESAEAALAHGLRPDQIILSAKSSTPRHLIALYRDLAARTKQPLHLGLTEAGMAIQGLVWSTAAMAVLLEEGIGDTIRVSLTPRPDGDRRDEVYAACEILQALGLRAFTPSITACPGCGRTDGVLYQQLAERTREYVTARVPEWRTMYPGSETLKFAVMGCIVNGPGESKAANVGISLPGKGESPSCPVYVDGQLHTRLDDSLDTIVQAFLGIIEEYVARRFACRS
ncbi:MAG TPA: flavodoxin-dependent (E)-4-hydroxy-3-methylbut-2-enyl-diphosphate synthase [Candidatus Hydrogenedentes bacterium]|nr:flavodoxin-dependent (E)-4-hydroxy-3-methylbut-2-enyl-diphosphate synthase [Candidatus Hydrogenedentota bacterium]HPG66012.1 flavodoxin-dependent (E)-4-hydroxy-3-methylbut-2-enyl-diphosphate synthase [Candidatus Hydrogenedentota bacterium]